MRRIAVIGAGIVGASVAFRLAQSGAQVWIIDRSRPGSGTTSTSFAWVNANQKTPRNYFELNYAGIREHFRLTDELRGGAPWLKPGGNLEWADDEAGLDALRRRVDRLRSWGYAAEWRKASSVNEELEPDLAFPGPDIPVAFFPEEAWVDAPQLTNTFVDLAREYGAWMRFGSTVESAETRDGHVAALRLGNGDHLPIDTVVNAAGTEADRVAALLGLPLPLKPSKGLLARLTVEEPPLRRIVHSRWINIRPDGPGHVLVHHASIDEKLEDSTSVSEDFLGQELLKRAREVIPALSAAEVEDVRVGVRPMPEDGLPCVGAVSAVGGYHEAVTHSGVTLGPLIGHLLAQEILTGEVDALIAPFRPDRFTRG